MKSKKYNLMTKLGPCGTLALLFVGYISLSPDNIKWVVGCFTDNEYLKRSLKQLSSFFSNLFLQLTEKIPLLTDKFKEPKDLIVLAIQFSVLFFLVWFIIGFFSSVKFLKRLCCTIIILLAFLAIWVILPLDKSYRFFDAFYTSFSIVFIAGWMASWLYNYSRNKGANALGLIAFVVIGALLYELLAYFEVLTFHENRWLRPTQILVCVFGLIDKQKDPADISNVHHNLVYGLYYIFHALLAFFAGYVIVGLISKAAVNTLLLRFLKSPNNFFWGVNQESLLLAKSIIKKDKSKTCVFVVPDLSSVDEGMLAQLSKEGFLWVPDGNAIKRESRKVENHFFLSPSGSDNIKWAEKLVDFVRKEANDVYVRIDDETDDSWLFRWANTDKIKGKLNVHIVRETSLVSDLLLRDYPTLEALGIKCKGGRVYSENTNEDFSFHLLQIGFGAQGRMLFNGTLCDVQAPGMEFYATIVDKQQEAFDLYDIRCPDIRKEYSFNSVTLDVQTKQFFVWLEKELKENEYSRIVITTGSDDLNLMIANFITNYYREKGDLSHLEFLRTILFVRVRYPENYADLQPIEKDKCLDFIHFGADKVIYSYENVVDFDIDKKAKHINAGWHKDKDEETAWRETSFFDRESSRASAMGFKNLLRLSGCQPLQKDDKTIFATLCEAEHLRWMAFHYVRGIRTWDPEKDTEIIENAFKLSEAKSLKIKENSESKYKEFLLEDFQLKANQIINANSHAALIPTKRLFRMDVFLDIKSFYNLYEILKDKFASDYELFKSYAKHLEDHFNYVVTINNNQTPGEEDFSNNLKLFLMNYCTFEFLENVKCIEKLTFISPEIITFFKKLLANYSNIICASYNDDQYEIRIKEALTDLSNGITKGIDNIDRWSTIFNSSIRLERNNVLALAKKIKYEEESLNLKNVSFKTLGNMVGKDEEIIKKHLSI